MEEAAQSFQSLGLSAYEAKALASLFAKHDSTAQDIAQSAEIPYTKIYAILNSLEKQGLVKCTLDRPKKYRPLDADSVVSSIIERQEDNLEELKKDAKRHVKTLDDIYNNGVAYQGNGVVWFLPTQQAVWDTVAEVLITMKKRHDTIADNSVWKMAVKNPKLAELACKALDNGAKGRYILPLTIDIDMRKVPISWLYLFLHKNDEIRFIEDNKVHHTLMIRDNSAVGLSFKNPTTGAIYGGIVLYDESIVKGTIDYFNMLWNQAMPIENKIRDAAKKELKRRSLDG